MRGSIALLALALLGAAPVKQAPPHKPIAPAARDWSRVAARTPAGTYLQGNPQARVKLVEYLSTTCPHCAHMAAVAVPSLTSDYIRTGRVSYEVRPASRDPLDLVALSFAGCTGPAGFFAVLPPLYAAQAGWVEKGYAFLQAGPAPEGKSNAELMATIAHAAGLDAFFAAHGLPAAKQGACLAGPDPAALSRMAQATWTQDFPGTPTFEINGTRIGVVGSWEDLKAKLVAAGA